MRADGFERMSYWWLVGRSRLVDGLGQRIQGGTVWWTVEVLSGIDESFARCLDKVEGHMVCDFALDVGKTSTAAGARRNEPLVGRYRLRVFRGLRRVRWRGMTLYLRSAGTQICGTH